jgi:hypothetical protein
MKLVAFLIFFYCPAFASWQKQSDNQLKLKTAIVVPKYYLEMQAAPEDSGTKAVFEPHTPAKTQFGLTYRNIGVSGSITNATSNEDDLKYGTSRSTDLNFRFFGRRTYEIFYQSYHGYYLKNSEDLDSSYNATNRKIVRSDMRSKNFGINLFWNFDEDDFSQALAFEQAGMAKSSGWGTSWLLHISESQIIADSAWIPSSSTNQFGKIAGLKELSRKSLATGFSLGGIATAKNIYLSAMLGLGFGYQNAIAIYENAEDEDLTHIGSYISVRTGLGYNGEKHSAGILFLSDSVNTPIGRANISGVSAEVSFYYSYRFDGVDIPLANTISGWLD